VEVWQTSNLWQLRLGEEKKIERRKNKRQDENIMVCPIPRGDHKKEASGGSQVNKQTIYINVTKNSDVAMVTGYRGHMTPSKHANPAHAMFYHYITNRQHKQSAFSKQ